MSLEESGVFIDWRGKGDSSGKEGYDCVVLMKMRENLLKEGVS